MRISTFFLYIVILVSFLSAHSLRANDSEESHLEGVVVDYFSDSDDSISEEVELAQEQDICFICYDRPVDVELICKTCNQPMSCKQCLEEMVRFSRSGSATCPFCRGKNLTLLRNNNLLPTPHTNTDFQYGCTGIIVVTIVSFGVASAMAYLLYFYFGQLGLV